jgi:hypothetical protein
MPTGARRAAPLLPAGHLQRRHPARHLWNRAEAAGVGAALPRRCLNARTATGAIMSGDEAHERPLRPRRFSGRSYLASLA